jgi:predicted dehydrogenase
VHGSGGVYRWKDGREVDDHVFATFEYPGGRTTTFSSIESNAFDHFYEAFFGTKGTLILKGETEAYLFEEGGGARPTGIEVAASGGGPVLEASESRAADAAGRSAGAASTGGGDRLLSYRNEISGFCAAVRTGVPLRCGPDKAIGSAVACLKAFDAIEQKTRLSVSATERT